MRSGYFGRCWEGLALFRASCVVLTVKFSDFDADLRCLEWFVPGIHAEIRLARLRLTLFGAIDIGWRDWHRLEDGHCGFWAMRCRLAVPMLPGCVDAAKWCQCLQDPSLGRDPAPRTPKYGHLLPTRRPRATMAT